MACRTTTGMPQPRRPSYPGVIHSRAGDGAPVHDGSTKSVRRPSAFGMWAMALMDFTKATSSVMGHGARSRFLKDGRPTKRRGTPRVSHGRNEFNVRTRFSRAVPRLAPQTRFPTIQSLLPLQAPPGETFIKPIRPCQRCPSQHQAHALPSRVTTTDTPPCTPYSLDPPQAHPSTPPPSPVSPPPSGSTTAHTPPPLLEQ